MDSFRQKSNIVAIINDDDCMKPDFWMDYSTQSKNDEFIHQSQIAKDQGHLAYLDFVNSRMIGWIIDVCDEYDSDLKQLSANWNMLCNNIFKVPAQKILLVDAVCKSKLPDDKDKQKNLKIVCDTLTGFGYTVKDKEFFMMCNGCHKLMLSELAQQNLWKIDHPRRHCRSCQQK